ncbi:MAG TPA: hypothetical protein VFE66_10280, partial [Bacteroidales bacterium]|nr:hypothetical protein [Bacteroidales bacterium]
MKNVTKLLTKSMLLIAVSILMFAKVGWAIDNYVQIGTGTSIVTGHPFYAYYADNRDQIIYLASEMSPTLMAGPLTKISFNYYGGYGAGFALTNFNIRMKNTTLSVSPMTGAFDEGGWTTVYSSASAAWPGSGWQIIILQTPFNWDGTSNLEIEVCHDNA